jgi:transcriptional regulator with GAF, ATPase, and Fis domain
VEIEASVPAISAILSRELPLDQLLVRLVKSGEVETIAVGFPDRLTVPAPRTSLTPAQGDRLMAWGQAGRLARSGVDPGEEWLAAAVAPGVGEVDLLCGPIRTAHDGLGVLVLVAPAGARFDEAHRRLAESLLEPFSTALDNDRRFRELAVLRQAAEADRRSLLARLGREDIQDTVVGAETGLSGVLQRVELVAPSALPVLLIGETGAGKELVARTIHRRSPRAAGAFIRVNCGAIPPELIDSQIFGHERGAFTGAVATRQGWFERADGGTLFLDEIGEFPPAAQVRLLRVLQDGWFERVGGHQPIHVDVRIVAATNQDLAAMVADSRFREDLWYRIAVFPIVLPPLRERRGDIPALARHFAERAARRFGLRLVLPTPEDHLLLQAYPWPGNVRELAAVVDRAAILGNGRQLEIATALGAGGPLLAPRANGAPAAASDRETVRDPGPGPLSEAVRRHIEQALALTRGRIEGPHGAAAMLEVNPHTLRARMRKLGLDWRVFRPSRGRADGGIPAGG